VLSNPQKYKTHAYDKTNLTVWGKEFPIYLIISFIISNLKITESWELISEAFIELLFLSYAAKISEFKVEQKKTSPKRGFFIRIRSYYFEDSFYKSLIGLNLGTRLFIITHAIK